jgi:hypothetical protein
MSFLTDEDSNPAEVRCETPCSVRGRAIMVDLCIHIANIFYLLSFLCLDMLWLRVLTCAGLTLGLVFFSCQPTPLYGPAVWHVVFLGINVVQIRNLLIERRQLTLSEEQEQVGEEMFRGYSREQLLTLLTRAMCKSPKKLQEFDELCASPLTPEERVLRDIAFSRLSRKDLLNLLTRRLWNSVLRHNPARWKWRRWQRKQGPVPDVAPKPE